MAHRRVQAVNVAYQGLAGAFSEAAAAALFPGATLVPRPTFAEVFAALEGSEVDATVVPVENTHAGSVVDVYDLLRQHSGAKVIAELILRVRHCLLGVPGAQLEGVQVARSHPQALAQVEDFLRARRIRPEVAFDTAGAAPWDYVFDLDFEGDPAAWPAREALALMRTCCEWIQQLGTYPAATEVLEPD